MSSLATSLLTFAKSTLDKGIGLGNSLGLTSAKGQRQKMKGKYPNLETAMPTLLGESQSLVDGLPASQGPDRGKQTHNLSGGIHGRRKAGSGDDFWQYRTYSTGDDLKSIDWRRSARGDNLYIRQNEWQTSEDIWFWCDPSASMLYRSNKALPSKSDTAHMLALAAATLFERGGERLGTLDVHDKPAAGRYGLGRLAEGFDLNRQTAHKNPERVTLPTTPPRVGAVASNAHVILFSDFLCEETELLKCLKSLSSNGIRGHLVHIIDPAEIDFPFTGRTLFKGLEGDGDHLSPRAEDFKQGYQNLMGGWMNTIQSLARHAGWRYNLQRSDESLTKTLLHLTEISEGQKGGRNQRGQKK